MADFIDDFISGTKRLSLRAAASASGSVVKELGEKMKLLWGGLGVPVAAGLLVLWDIGNYTFDKDKITREYASQIAAKRGIRPNELSTQNMVEVAKENPTIGEALRRSKRKRDLNIVLDVICTAGAFALAVYFAGPLVLVLTGAAVTTAAAAAAAATTLGGIICAAAISFVSYYAGKTVLGAIGKKMLGLSEPNINLVELNPELQSKLSLPSQIRYIEHLQKHGKVFPSQILEVFKKANPDLSAEAIQQQYDIPQIAQDINQRLIYAQELAFKVHGQQSGVPKQKPPEPPEYQRKLAALGSQAAGKIGEISSVAKEKAVDAAGNVSNAVKTGTAVAKDKLTDAAHVVSETVSGKWQSLVRKKNILTPGEIAEQRLAEGSPITPENIAAQQEQSTTAAVGV